MTINITAYSTPLLHSAVPRVGALALNAASSYIPCVRSAVTVLCVACVPHGEHTLSVPPLTAKCSTHLAGHFSRGRFVYRSLTLRTTAQTLYIRCFVVLLFCCLCLCVLFYFQADFVHVDASMSLLHAASQFQNRRIKFLPIVVPGSATVLALISHVEILEVRGWLDGWRAGGQMGGARRGKYSHDR